VSAPGIRNRTAHLVPLGIVARMRGPRRGRRIWILAATAAIGWIVPAAAHGAPLKAAPDNGEWLFVQEAQEAKLRPLPGSRGFRLTLIRPSPTVQAFTDRPARRLELEPLDRFVDAWSRYGFKQVPPNAAIEVDRGGKRSDVVIVELSRPRLSKSGSLSYRAKPLRGSKRASDLRYFQRRADRRLPARLGPTTLFIDDADDSSAQLEISFQASAPDWHAVFILSSMNLESFQVGGAGFARYEAGNNAGGSSAFALETFGGGGTVTGTVTAGINPLGDCVPITIDPIAGAPQSLTGRIGLGPSVPLAYGPNKVPVDAQANCG